VAHFTVIRPEFNTTSDLYIAGIDSKEFFYIRDKNLHLVGIAITEIMDSAINDKSVFSSRTYF